MFQYIADNQRGAADHGWLKSKHSFSFADYHNPEMMGFGPLRVINEDIISPQMGFAPHPHKNMEIITWPLKGSLSHKDSMGNAYILTPGEMQYMSAGSGVTHSEFNHSPTEELHLLQIWIYPQERNITPNYGQKKFPEKGRLNQWQHLVSPDGTDGSVKIAQDAHLFVADIQQDAKLDFSLKKERLYWVQIPMGSLSTSEGFELKQGDALAINDEEKIIQFQNISSTPHAQILLFDLPIV